MNYTHRQLCNINCRTQKRDDLTAFEKFIRFIKTFSTGQEL